MSGARIARALEELRPLCIATSEGMAALAEYSTLADQAKVLCALLPGDRKDAKLLRRGKSGLRVMEERLLATLQTMIPVNEGAVECLSEDEPVSPLADIPFLPWFPHGDEMQGEYLEYLPEAERLACLVSWGATPEQVAVSFGLDEVPALGAPRYEEALVRLREQPEPQRFLADALQVVNKDTGVYAWDGLCAAAH
ncbi:MAG: hypothetical protein U0166_29200, partial [Acidobacteriota bacterium]